MYGSSLDSIVRDLRDKLSNADSSREELREHKYEVEEAVNDLDSYIDELEGLIDSLDSVPTVDISVSVDVTFNSED